jgi:hypothetical protein
MKKIWPHPGAVKSQSWNLGVPTEISAALLERLRLGIGIIPGNIHYLAIENFLPGGLVP